MTFDAAQKMQEAQSLHQQGQLDLAKSIYEEILSRQPQNADALHFLGLLYHQKKENDRALSLMEQSLQLSPDNPIYFANCGMVHKAKGDYRRALACYDRSLELNSDSARTRTNRGNVLASLGLFSEALLEHEKALQLDPRLPEIYNNQGGALQSLRRFEESLSSYQRAIELNPLYAEAYLNRGIAQKSLGQNHLAMESFKRAIQLSQNNPRLFHARADLYFDGGFLSEALQDYEKVLALEPDAEGALGNLMFVKRRLCLWDGFAQDYSRLEKLVCVDHQRTIPWAFLSYTDSLRVLQQVNELEAQVFKLPVEQEAPQVVPFSTPVAKPKIRIAYCSPDFKNHPVGYLFIGLLEAHNREAFELIGVSLGPPVTDDLRRRFQDS
ncbi:tetratricopeptide repeat protein, partial [bacterium]|nr:tetratricopeptide repeat protein [bacterium]